MPIIKNHRAYASGVREVLTLAPLRRLLAQFFRRS